MKFMTKKSVLFITAALCTFFILSCSKTSKNTFSQISSSSKTKEVLIEYAGIPSADERGARAKPFTMHNPDIDLTKMSATMIYSEVFNMMISPEEYEGKLIRIKGNFRVMLAKGTDYHYFSVVVPDATACCEQGIEVVWCGKKSYPSDYPEINEEITVTGKFVSEETEEGISYNYLLLCDPQ